MHIYVHKHTHHFNSYFPGKPALAGCPLDSPSSTVPLMILNKIGQNFPEHTTLHVPISRANSHCRVSNNSSLKLVYFLFFGVNQNPPVSISKSTRWNFFPSCSDSRCYCRIASSTSIQHIL